MGNLQKALLFLVFTLLRPYTLEASVHLTASAAAVAAQTQIEAPTDVISVEQKKFDGGSAALANRLALLSLCTAYNAHNGKKASTLQWYTATALSVWNDEINANLPPPAKYTFNPEHFEKAFEDAISSRLSGKTIPAELNALKASLSKAVKNFTENVSKAPKKYGVYSTKSLNIMTPELKSEMYASLDSAHSLSLKEKSACETEKKNSTFWAKYNYFSEDVKEEVAEENGRTLAESKETKTETPNEAEDTSVPATTAAVNKTPKEKVADAPNAETQGPHKKTEDTPELPRATPIPPTPVAAAPVPAKDDLEERAKALLPQEEPKSEAGKGLFSRFKNWLTKRNKEKVGDFHSTTLAVLKQDPEFKPYLIDRNPLADLCTNYLTELTVSQRERVLSKVLLVHLITENFDSNKTENLGSYLTNSVGPWQTSMNSKSYGCTFKDQDEIKFNIEKNIFCNFKFYAFREKNYDQIYGKPDPFKKSGLHWSVLKEGRGLFEEKFEPLFRESVPECKNEYSKKKQKNVNFVNGHSPAAVKDFISSAI